LDLHWTDGTATAAKLLIRLRRVPEADAGCSAGNPVLVLGGDGVQGNDADHLRPVQRALRVARSDNNNTTEGWQCWRDRQSVHGHQLPGRRDAADGHRGQERWSEQRDHGWAARSSPTTSPTGCSSSRPTPTTTWVASWHSYNFNTCSNQSCWTSQVAPVIAQVPVVAGEIGENDCSGSYINPLTTWLDSESTSYLAWAWNSDFQCSSGPGLVTDYRPGTRPATVPLLQGPPWPP